MNASRRRQIECSPPTCKHPPPSPKPVKLTWFTRQSLQSLVPLERADEPLVLKSPEPAWLVSLVGNRFHKGSRHALKPTWNVVLQSVHEANSERRLCSRVLALYRALVARHHILCFEGGRRSSFKGRVDASGATRRARTLPSKCCSAGAD
jgi:hypothetical protein